MSTKDLLPLFTILEAIQKVKIYIQDIPDEDAFYHRKDQLFFNATVGLLIAIGEEAKKLSSEAKNKHVDIDWGAIIGMRNIAAHDYRGIDPSIVWDSAKDYLPSLEITCLNILKEYADNDKLTREYIKEFLENPYYRHLKGVVCL